MQDIESLNWRYQFVSNLRRFQLNCYEILWLYIDKDRLQGIKQNFYCNYPKNSLSWNSVYPCRIWLAMTCFCLCSKLKPWPEEQTPCDSSFSGGIICGPHRGSFAVRDHLQSSLRTNSSLGIICRRGSFEALYSCTTVCTGMLICELGPPVIML